VITKGTTPTTLGYDFSETGVPFLRVQNIEGGKLTLARDTLFIDENTHRVLERSQIRPGDVLVSIAGTIGRAGVVPDEAPPLNCNQAVAIIRAREDVHRPFLRYWLESSGAQAQMRGATVTGTISNLSLTQLGNLRLPLPPIAEQRRIAEILDKADALRAKRRTALAQLDNLTQAVFLDMFGDAATNPKGWPTKAFGQVCETRLGKMLDQKQQTGEHRRPYLRNANVQWFRFDLSSLLEMDFDEDDRRVLRLEPGDLLICEGGEPGRAAVWRGELEECYFQKALHRARPDPNLASPEYLAWLLWFLAQGGKLSGVTSATIAHLTGEKLAVLPTMLPPPPLQREFAYRVTSLERVTCVHGAGLSNLDALFASLQHRAFRGEL
jgi:type I restriction enzyme S subunit